MSATVDAFQRGFIKAAVAAGVHPTDILKLAGSGIAPTMMGALPGAAVGGYLAYDRAINRKKVEPNSITPEHAAALGALLGGGAGGIAGAAAGGLGFERGTDTANADNQALLQRFIDAYKG